MDSSSPYPVIKIRSKALRYLRGATAFLVALGLVCFVVWFVESQDSRKKGVQPSPSGVEINQNSRKEGVQPLPSGMGIKLRATLKGHVGAVYAVAITPDGKLLASGGKDKSVRL